ncbi:MAG: sterol desaturase family protein [Opitutaceae bacterium]
MHLSRASFFADFYVYPSLAAVFVAFALIYHPHRWIAVTVAFFVGIATWTFVEYIMHRWVLHHLTWIKDQHAKHHDDAKALIGTPTWLSLVVMLILVLGPAATYTDFSIALSFTAGLMLGYLGYTLAHYVVHHWASRPNSYLFRLKQRHALHHHYDDLGNFGVSNGFWDYVFRTNIVVRRDTPVTGGH